MLYLDVMRPALILIVEGRHKVLEGGVELILGDCVTESVQTEIKRV